MIKINIIGSIFGSTGYDSHTRSLANALYKVADCKLSTQLPEDWMKHVSDSELDMITKPERKDDYNLIISMPHTWKLFTGSGKNIGYVIWEGDSVPVSWIEEFLNPKIDLIFVPSEHTKQAILKSINEVIDTKFEYFQGWIINKYFPDNDKLKQNIIDKIKVIPHGCNREIFYNLNKPKQDDIFRFVVNKGWRGTNWDRGGVQYLLKAFAEEFRKEEKVQLILKLNPCYIDPKNIKQCIDALNLPEDRAQIHINCEMIPFDKLINLYNQADCFVCPTRAESFNLPGLEAMSCGLPTIQTKFGGQIDYMTDKNSLFVDYELNYSEELPLYENIKWAIPDIKDLKYQLRFAFENQDLIKNYGKQAEEDSKSWTWDISAKKIIDIL